jgi:hypothetical protein
MVECKYGDYYGTDIAEIAEELNVTPFGLKKALGLIDRLKILRQRVKEERGEVIDGSFNDVLRTLGSEMQRRHGRYGEK